MKKIAAFGKICIMLYAEGTEWGRMCQYARTLLGQIRVQVITRWREDLGAEIVEAAFVIPVVLMLLMGIVTFGRAYNVYQTITRAAREGARELVLTPCAEYPNCPGSNTVYNASTAQTDLVDPVLASDSLDPSKVINYTTTYVFLDPTDPSPYICGIQISFQYPYTLSLPFTSINLSTINLSTKVQMRMENQPTTCPAGEAVPSS